jgi:hypothetical protein
MRVLISHEMYEGFGGTETYMLTVAQELQWLGHDTVIHAQRIGPIAEFARGQGIRVTDTAAQLPRSIDLLLAQDAASAFELSARFPDAVCVFVAHSRGYPGQFPPQIAEVCQAVVVLNDRVRRFMELLPFSPPIVRLRQPIDLGRFGALGLYPERPRRAAVIGNYLRGAQAALLEQACNKVGMEVSWIGAHAGATSRPEHAIADVDVVIGLGRCVLEAMACRRAAYVYGVAGGDGWVTPSSYAELEADGFSGQVTRVPLDLDALAATLRDWDVAMGHDNRALAAAHHGALGHATALIELARDLGSPDREPLTHAQELARLVRAEWYARGRYAGVAEDNRGLRVRLAEAERQVERSRAGEAAHARALRATRRYRLACRIAAPLDRARARLRRRSSG